MEFSSFEEIISFATQKEAGAQVFYESAAKVATRAETKLMFSELAREEQRHRERLHDLKQEDLAKITLQQCSHGGLSASLPDAEFTSDMTYRETLTLAIKAEEKSLTLYRDLSQRTGDLSLRYLFHFLADQEALHKAKLELEYDQQVLKED